MSVLSLIISRNPGLRENVIFKKEAEMKKLSGLTEFNSQRSRKFSLTLDGATRIRRTAK